ncbi:MAG TPA: PHB depolymerase family esterase [Actinocrinis sp.]|uniref:extracellular catalytic domain type 1 short-chain-length polyhydroxyalkanoate depolymerase n=1 Tax=Actinocrinis sp. TaxID=1920516 RepID=UPI002DDCC9B0|nr:PHB depolymerase family esterase [Actinocrinis sp.]HEV2348035.1 PHB depolymerase family esterase [Actinocrinis sp.]
MLRPLIRAVSRAGRGLGRPVAALGVGTALCLGALAAAPAASATTGATGPGGLPAPTSTLQQVTDFGPNPTNLKMYLYVPQHVHPHPAVIVALHYCGGSGPAFFGGTEYASLADQYGFIVIYPSVTRTSLVCFDVSTPGALTHDGNSDPVGIVSMVRYVEKAYHADKQQVFATGISSGAMMTNVLLGDYPDVFAAGSAMSGVPFGCFATTDGSLWNSTCSSGQLSMTPEQWGDLARAAYPTYHGPRPRMQLWHGTADAVLLYPNFNGEVAQWTNVLHADLAYVDSPQPTWTHSVYVDKAGKVQVDAYSVAGEDHNLGFHYFDWAKLAIQFFGITDHQDD